MKPENYPILLPTVVPKTSHLGAFALIAFTLLLPLADSRAQQSEQSAAPPPIHDKATPAKAEKDVIARLEQIIPHLMTEGEIPGLSIALIRDGRTVWSRGFGIKNADTKEPVDDNTVFEAASLSKPVFVYAVLTLVDSGKLDLDTPLTKYLPGKYDVGDDARLNQITARRVLSHTTGFPNWRPRGDESVDQTLKIYFTPGDRFSYSGEGFVYLARVVEHLTGEKLEAFMKRTIFDPLGMKSSSYVWQASYEARKTFTHNSLGAVSGRDKPEKANAAASLHTTANDYARFVCAMYRTDNKGTGSGNDRSGPASEPSSALGLRSATVRLMVTPQISVPVDRSNSLKSAEAKLSTTISWGLGWGLEKTDDGMAFWHWGDNGDTKAYVVALEKQKSAMVMFANSSNGLSIIQEVVDDALGGQHPALGWINVERYNSPARLMLKAIIKSNAEAVLTDYRKRRSEPRPPAIEGQPANGSSASAPKSQDQSPTTNLSLTEVQMNRLGYQLLALKRVKDAIEVFKQNTVDFPEGFNTWDSLAEGFMVNGEKDLAIKYYKKSLELNPANTNAVQKLKELGGVLAQTP